ncbi:MAG: hypothetical protein JSS34_04410 [Proteobacteria bacterium]|nr:hypothetical protein [Pseudomonadota bacterium]
MKTFVFIDSVGSGRELAYLFKANQMRVINIKTPIFVSGQRTESNIFNEEIEFNMDFSSLVKSLAKQRIIGFYAPVDYNHKLKYELTKYFFPERINSKGDPDTSNKDTLQSFLKKLDIPNFPCVEIDDEKTFSNFIKNFDMFIVKPRLSNGSINTKVYNSSNYDYEFQNKKGGYFRNSSFIAQPYFLGKEYTCSFSWYMNNDNKLKIKIRSIVHLEKILVDGVPVPQLSTLVNHEDKIVKRIETYLEKICPYLPMKFGSASFGFILEACTDILYIIDFNDRLSDLSGSSLGTFKSTGGTQMLDFINLHICPEEFNFQANLPYLTRSLTCIFYLLVKKEGFLNCSTDNVGQFNNAIKNLDSYQTHYLEVFDSSGIKYVNKTIRQRQQIARVTLSHRDPNILKADKEKMFAMQEELNDSIRKDDTDGLLNIL